MGLTKQAFHQHLDRQLKMYEEQQQLIPMILEIRTDHPRMGSREMYRLIQPQSMGRDRFEDFCFENGFKLEIKKSFIRTTNSLGVTRFANQILGLEVTHANQVWVSDITYYRIGDRFYYLTFIMDLYSRWIKGFAVSENLFTENTTIPSLRMALTLSKPPSGLILHSDGGGQYYSKIFLALTKKNGIVNSMCDSVYENPHAERVNGTIKNDYLVFYNPQNYLQLYQMTQKAIYMYNYIRPHQSVNRLSPVKFEELLTEKRVVDKRKKDQKRKETITNITFENQE
jgi:hypothetical protein